MEYKDIASISGKGGLFKVLKPTKAGVILESMDDNKKKIVAGISQQVSVLDEISIYTTDASNSVSLATVLQKIHEEFGDDLGVNGKSSNDELKSFFKHILPNHDESRVYPSVIKKIISWYSVLLEYAPELLKNNDKEAK